MPSAVDFDGVNAACARRLAGFGELVDLLARPHRRAGRDYSLHVAFEFASFARRLEMRSDVVQFHAETQIGLVRTVAAIASL